jgi:acyl-homoserine lactone acylase PvdQ
MEEWHPIHSLALLRLLNFHLSANWSQELMRDILDQLGGLDAELVDEMVPFNRDHFGGSRFVTILDESDLEKPSQQTLMERYLA